ncbi:MAG TPA: DUF4062 domain-containing protein [Armatimonadota bacterium]|nr:DUF4062 domain-containing protein [Armatimonadota bacterium]
MKTVFLSSTFRDLEKYREVVVEAIEALDGYHCVRMENFGARAWETDAFCRAQVVKCDVFVGVVGHLYGSCFEETGQSYTEREYEAAIEADKPRLMFIAPEDFPVPAKLIEPDQQREKQRAFRECVSRHHIRDTFTSPDDLARRVIQAIRNWEQELTTGLRDETAAPIMPLPPQSYFAHPYPLQPNFTGRVNERKRLAQWLAGNQPVLALTAIGGMGKSALAWVWVQRDVLGFPLPGSSPEPPETANACRVKENARPDGVLWWSFYEREASFESFLNEALKYASGGKQDPADIPSAYDKVKALIALLQDKRILLVLDGFERELRAYASLSAPYQGDAVDPAGRDDFRCCTDPHAADFLRRAAALPLQSRILLTSRLFPRELEDLSGCRSEDLKAMHPDDAVEFFRAQGVRGTRAEIEDACNPYGYHPLALRLLAGVIVNDRRSPGDVQVAGRHPVLPELKGKEHHHILQVAYETLARQKRALLSKIAAFRSPMTYDALLVFNPDKGEERFDAALDELTGRGLLFLDRERNRYDLHPVVRQYAYDRLADKEGVHARLRDYFAAVPAPDEEKVESLEDLASVIELYHHTVRAGRCDEACDMFRDRLSRLTYYRFGAYQLQIELLRALFPDGEDISPSSGQAAMPRLREESDQAWTLGTLASAYGVSGQPRRAVPLFELDNALCEKAGDKLSLSIVLSNLAIQQIMLGGLASAERSLRRRIELCREIPDEFREAVGHLELGRLLAHEGLFGESEEQLRTSQSVFDKAGAQQTNYVSVVRAYGALRALLMGDAGAALNAAREARTLADEVARTRYPHERDFVRAEWLLGAALTALAAEDKARENKLLTDAETHLKEALMHCRTINMVDHEPDILLAWARWHRAKGRPEQAREDAEEALSIADRCEFRLCQADIHNFLARLDLEAGDRASAVNHAQTARERALCDGPPHCYKPALEEADRLLKELGIVQKGHPGG